MKNYALSCISGNLISYERIPHNIPCVWIIITTSLPSSLFQYEAGYWIVIICNQSFPYKALDMSLEICWVVNGVNQFWNYIFLKVHPAHSFRHLDVIAVLWVIWFCRWQFLLVLVCIDCLIHHYDIMGGRDVLSRHQHRSMCYSPARLLSLSRLPCVAALWYPSPCAQASIGT